MISGSSRRFPSCPRVFSAVAAASVLLAAGTASAANGCPATKPPRVIVVTEKGPLSYDYGKSGEQIEKMVGKSGLGSHVQHGRVRGLTHSQLSVKFSNALLSSQLGSGRFCLALTEVTATLGYDRTTVYVDRKYRKGSCEFNAIMEHENQHVLFNRASLAQSAPKIKAALEEAVPKANPLIVEALGSGKKRQMDLLQTQLAPHISAMNAARDRLNATIDTAQSYRATQAKCRNW